MHGRVTSEGCPEQKTMDIHHVAALATLHDDFYGPV